ncbi:hypothetical protein ACET3Z_014065 [Daucus carota]
MGPRGPILVGKGLTLVSRCDIGSGIEPPLKYTHFYILYFSLAPPYISCYIYIHLYKHIYHSDPNSKVITELDIA